MGVMFKEINRFFANRIPKALFAARDCPAKCI
jgi:hypothetical protein